MTAAGRVRVVEFVGSSGVGGAVSLTGAEIGADAMPMIGGGLVPGAVLVTVDAACTRPRVLRSAAPAHP